MSFVVGIGIGALASGMMALLVAGIVIYRAYKEDKLRLKKK